MHNLRARPLHQVLLFLRRLAHWFKNYKLYFKIFTGLHVCLEQPCAQHLFSIIMQNKAQHGKEHLNKFEEKKCLFSVCFIYLKYFKNVRINECINKWTNEHMRRINLKMNLVFVKNMVAKVVTIKQDCHHNERHHTRSQSNCIFRKRVIISLSNFIKLITSFW